MVVAQRVLGLKAHWLWSLGSASQVHLFPVLWGQAELFGFLLLFVCLFAVLFYRIVRIVRYFMKSQGIIL